MKVSFFAYLCNMENESQVSSEYTVPLKFSDSEVSIGLTEIASGRHFRIFKVCRNGRWQVLKGLQPDFAADAFWMGVLEKEYDIAKDLDHPNIVRVRGCENNPDVGPCIVMDKTPRRRNDVKWWSSCFRPCATTTPCRWCTAT